MVEYCIKHVLIEILRYIVSLSSIYYVLCLYDVYILCTYCKLLWIKASAKCPKCKCELLRFTLHYFDFGWEYFSFNRCMHLHNRTHTGLVKAQIQHTYSVD